METILLDSSFLFLFSFSLSLLPFLPSTATTSFLWPRFNFSAPFSANGFPVISDYVRGEILFDPFIYQPESWLFPPGLQTHIGPSCLPIQGPLSQRPAP